MSSEPSSPPAYLLPGFDPTKVKVAELRGILLAHNIPYASNAKKSELVDLFRTRVLPLVPQLLAELSAVRASDTGVLDGNSHDGSLRELDTDFEESSVHTGESAAHDSIASSRKDGKKKKSKRKSMVGRAHEAAAAAEELESEQESVASPRKKRTTSSRRYKASEDLDDDINNDGYPAEYDEVVPLADEPAASSASSPKKRKAGDQTTPRTSSILKKRRETIQSEGEAGFSDFNPFQSGGEDTPGREIKRRKSSLNPERVKERTSNPFDLEDEPERPAPEASSPRKSLGATSPEKVPSSSTARSEVGTTANAWSSSTPEAARQRLLNPDGAYKSGSSLSSNANRRATMGPLSSASRLLDEEKKTKTSRASVGGAAAPSVGVKFMAPVDKVKTTSPEAQRRLKEFEEMQRREKLRRERDEEEKQRKARALEEAEAEVRRLESERARQAQSRHQEAEDESDAMEVDDLEYEHADVEEDPLEDPAAEFDMEQDEFVDERDPFEAGDRDEEEEEFEEELFGESNPAPVPVVEALRGNHARAPPRHSEPLPYSPRRAQLVAQQQAIANTPRRSFPLPTPPASSSRRQMVSTSSRSSATKSQQQKAISVRPDSTSVVSSKTVQTFKRVSTWTIAVVALVYSLWWREEKLAVGFCDTNSRSNPLVAQRATSLAVPSLPASLCSTLDALQLRPTCTPCPTHGFCQSGKFVGCSIDYVPRASALRLGGLLPIAPACVPDTEKLMVVAMQASKASKLLRKRRGEVVCGGLERLRKKQIAAGAARAGTGDHGAFVYGLEADHVLNALMRENEASKSPFSEGVLEELNRLALSDLVNHGEVLTWQDGDAYWYASKTAEMPLTCQARLAAIRSAKKHKTGLAGLFSALMSLLWVRYKLEARKQDKRRVAELVETALVQLQRQERSHHADPVLVPFPHIAPSHLRDLVLQHVHSPARRAHLWKKVEKVVEGNSNVRVMEVEQNGEELRGWQWIGATGGAVPREIEVATATSIGGSSAPSSPEKKEKPEMFQSGKSVFASR